MKIEEETRMVRKEFERYGFKPFKIEEVNLKEIESSVLEIVAGHLFEAIRKIDYYGWRNSEYAKQEENWDRRVRVSVEEEEISEEISALMATEKVWLNQYLIKDDVVGNIKISHRIEELSSLISSSDDKEYVVIEVKGKEIFSAQWGWDLIDKKSIKIATTLEARKAFQAVTEKAKGIKETEETKEETEN